MPMLNLEYQHYLENIWERAYTDLLVIIDYTGQAEAASRIAKLRRSLFWRKNSIRNLKLQSAYVKKWDRFRHCSILTVSPSILHIQRTPILYMDNRFKRKLTKPALPFPLTKD